MTEREFDYWFIGLARSFDDDWPALIAHAEDQADGEEAHGDADGAALWDAVADRAEAIQQVKEKAERGAKKKRRAQQRS